jgi:hypothetical protein
MKREKKAEERRKRRRDKIYDSYINSCNLNNRIDIDALLFQLERIDQLDKNRYTQVINRIKDESLLLYFHNRFREISGNRINLPEKPLVSTLSKSSRKLGNISFIILNWEDVHFYNGYYIFKPKNVDSCDSLKLELKVKEIYSLESFNYIRSYFNLKLPEIRYFVDENRKIKIIDEVKFSNAILMLAQRYKQAVIEKKEIQTDNNSKHKMTLKQALEKGERMTFMDFRKYKSRFLEFLINSQSSEYRIVPIEEAFEYKNSSYVEDAFLFTLLSENNSIIIVLENVNPSRSTILFKTKRSEYIKALSVIYSFILGDSLNKRSEIRSHSLNFQNHGITKYKSINHDSFEGWKFEVLKFLI